MWMLIITVVILSDRGLRSAWDLLCPGRRVGHSRVKITGTAIGLISTIGFLPDVFMGPLSGYFLDYYPGETGHRLLFATVGGFALVGFMASVWFKSITTKGNAP